MTILQIIILVISLAAVALAIGYFRQRGQKSLAQLTEVYYDNEIHPTSEADIAQQLYDKDLRPIVPITPQVVNKVVEISKRVPQGAVLDIKAVANPTKAKIHRTKKQ